MKDVRQTYQRIRDNFYEFPKHIALTETAKSLIRRMLNPVPGELLSIPHLRLYN